MLNIPLPLMIFIRMHSQDHNKCLICSIMSVIYAQLATFVSAFGIHIQTLVLVRVTSDKNFKKLCYRSKKHFKLSTESRMFLTYSFNKVPTGVFLCVLMSNGTQVDTMRNERDQKMADCQSPDRFCSHSVPQHSRSLIQISIDG